MLTQETKRKIDSARQILVGKVPDPKAQVEQITIALIYKFMDDMDKGSERLGGKASFFTNGYEKYSWSKLMDLRLSGHERLELYIEAITSLSNNPYIPQLFRDILKDAFLPYRSPETLNLFLKEINGFVYEHSEDLGDAFEYLLSVLGSQGDAGQFRTPRHLIDFIVEIVDPKKNETICDPACGTAGFLISAFKHIINENQEKPLTPEEKEKLMDNFVGYDISPDMVRLSKVNMFLHLFPDPKIYEYDTLSNEERWNEKFDVILANPPFMTPKGGIRPHKRFSIPANRSEVLFVDYIMEHLNFNGRAGIIVPEGIIFQSAKAYKQLRKMLIEDNYLYAVVSLPPGVFNPYSGVKTSILLLDRRLAKISDSILFIKIHNDGFDLGAQRRPIDKNDLPEALEILKAWKQGNKKESDLALWVKKDKIAENDDYNLTADRYKEVINFTNQKWPMVELKEVCVIDWGNTNITKKSYVIDGQFLGVSAAGCDGRMTHFEHEVGVSVLSAIGANCGKIFYPEEKFTAIKNTITFTPDREKILPKFLYLILKNNKIPHRGGGQPFISKGDTEKYKIPLPPLEVQKEIVEQIEVKQKVIDSAKAVIENLEKERRYFGQSLRKLEGVEWVELGEVCEVARGGSPRPINKFITKADNGINWIKIGDVKEGEKYITRTKEKIKPEGASKTRLVKEGDLVLSNSMSFGRPYILKISGAIHDGWLLFRLKNKNIASDFLYYILGSPEIKIQFSKFATGGVVKNLNSELVRKIKIPLPPLEVQKQLVAKMEELEQIIEANKKLIKIMEQKINEVINSI